MRNPFARKKKNHTLWKVLGGTALAAVGGCVIVMFPDIKRYIKMSTM